MGLMERLTVCVGADIAAWAAALQPLLPDLAVSAWQPGEREADYALIWKPPPAFCGDAASECSFGRRWRLRKLRNFERVSDGGCFAFIVIILFLPC